MKNKSLKGFLKSQHFQERQKQRKVSDLQIVKAITRGSLVENDYGHNFLLDNLKVTVDLTNGPLITVHPGDPSTRNAKVLSKEEALKLRELIEESKTEREAQNKEEHNDFLEYVTKFSVKKI